MVQIGMLLRQCSWKVRAAAAVPLAVMLPFYFIAWIAGDIYTIVPAAVLSVVAVLYLFIILAFTKTRSAGDR